MSSSLSGLRAFVEVARSQSFTRAAETLCVTQSAVSKQIHMLEHQLGFRLFERARRALVLTPAGSTYLAYAAEAVAMLEQGRAMGLEAVGQVGIGSSVEVSASPAFAAHWLVSRLPALLATSPSTQIKLRPRLPDLSPVTERFDLEIRVGGGRWPDAHATYLLGREMALVASPRLLQGRRVRSARDLDDLPRLHRAQRGYDWKEWSERAAPDWLQGPENLVFEGFSVLIPAALAGCGLAVCPLFMVLDALRSGALVRPLGECVESRYAFYAVLPAGGGRNSARDRMLDWMRREAQRTEDELKAHLAGQHSIVE